ncbi:MAG: GntR family transcriptional regulator [Anaerolineae bacterium]|nr:GntR family transcriptional regulator [Anaerolineae bacterium]
MDVDRAYELLREQITSLEIEPGVPIDETTLARRLGMPPGSVHHAIDELVQEGWIERDGNSVRVTDDTMARIFRQSFEVRSVLEALCARLAVQRATEPQLASLEAMMPQFEETARRADSQTWLQLDRRFHEAIYDAADNVFLGNALRQLYELDMRIWYQILNRMTDLPRIIESHRAIVQALKARDASAAERAVTRHIQNSRDQVLPRS